MKATTRRPAIFVFAFVMMVVRVGSAGATGDVEPVLLSIDCFLERQMDRFWPPPEDYPPEFQDAQLIQTYDVEESDPEFVPLYHRADTYDAALAAIYFMRRGNLVYARRLLDGILFVQTNDPQYDPEQGCPTRTSYWANDLLAPNRQDPSIDHWQIATGNLAYQIIALTRFYRVTGEEKYLNAARCMAEWIEVHTNQCDIDGFGGFSLGLEQDGSPIEESTKARTIEHNVDVYAFATTQVERSFTSNDREVITGGVNDAAQSLAASVGDRERSGCTFPHRHGTEVECVGVNLALRLVVSVRGNEHVTAIRVPCVNCTCIVARF